MNSNHTKQIINEIAEEEGLSEKSIRLIVNSQFENTNKIITSGIPDDSKSFKSIKINAFGTFRFMTWKFKHFMGRERYDNEKRRIYDSKR